MSREGTAMSDWRDHASMSRPKPEPFTGQEWELVLQALEFQQRAFGGYQHYPSPLFREQRMEANQAVIDKVRALRKATSTTEANARVQEHARPDHVVVIDGRWWRLINPIVNRPRHPAPGVEYRLTAHLVPVEDQP